ncbi:unnamed protein product [Lactuca virosa]|uniref:F-box domain-containing protein n=1 Tax=Lactuca virosa TaxID=75947 RepID=A0AAU9ME46_9ASTR|nr:unnamed protein product [Lactuca virosa]
MATADDGRAPHESGAVGEMFRKRHFRPGGNSASMSVTIGISKLEQMLQQMTFTSSETQHLIALLHSRTMEESSSSPVIRFEASTTSSSLKKHKHGVVEEHIALPAELPKTPMTSPQHPMTMENLPDELFLLNIFIRLSAKQLAQMRSVSKSWNALLS